MPTASSRTSRLRRPALWIPLTSAALAIIVAVFAWVAFNGAAQQAAAAPNNSLQGAESSPPTTSKADSGLPETELLPGVPFPAEFEQVEERSGETVGQPVVVTRFQDQPEIRLGGEQISTARTPQGDVLGYVDFRLPANPAGPLPSEAVAERAAFELLNQIDAEYAAGLTVQWVDRHDETVLDATGTEQTLSGVKVKTIHENGRYTWLIYGADSRLIAYERDMPWDGTPRVTGVWLEEREGVDGPR